MNPAIFREYDLRGVVGKDLNDERVYQLGRAIGTYAVHRGADLLTTGRDCSLSSEGYQQALNAGL